MDKLEFYQKQYAFLVGEMDRAIDALERQNPLLAQQTLTNALATTEQRWIDTFPAESSEADPDSL